MAYDNFEAFFIGANPEVLFANLISPSVLTEAEREELYKALSDNSNILIIPHTTGTPSIINLRAAHRVIRIYGSTTVMGRRLFPQAAAKDEEGTKRWLIDNAVDWQLGNHPDYPKNLPDDRPFTAEELRTYSEWKERIRLQDPIGWTLRDIRLGLLSGYPLGASISHSMFILARMKIDYNLLTDEDRTYLQMELQLNEAADVFEQERIDTMGRVLEKIPGLSDAERRVLMSKYWVEGRFGGFAGYSPDDQRFSDKLKELYNDALRLYDERRGAREKINRIVVKPDCIATGLPLIGRVYADGGAGSATSLSSCGLWLTPNRAIRAMMTDEGRKELAEWARAVGGGGGGDKKKKIGLLSGGIGAGLLISRLPLLGDCTVQPYEQTVFGFFNRIGLGSVSEWYARGFADGCTRWPTEITIPSVPGIRENLGLPYDQSRHYFCDSADPGSPVYEILPNQTLILMGSCGEGRTCQEDRCVLDPVESRDVLNTETATGLDVLDSAEPPALHDQARTDVLYLSQRYGLVFTSRHGLTWRADDVHTIRETCDALPLWWCRNVVVARAITAGGGEANSDAGIVYISEQYPVTPGAFVHELMHVGAFTYGYDTNTSARFFGFHNKIGEILRGEDEPTDYAIPAGMLAEYMVASGWYFDRDAGEWRPSPTGLAEGVNPYQYANPNESIGVNAESYFEDSEALEETQPEIHDFLKQYYFDGQEYKDGVPTSPAQIQSSNVDTRRRVIPSP
ncbi:hypothetical protein HY411_01835 [Candidatus Gottesmanbacteria bacterium]|nr:hypothetical protein [Candidatus Gottesmanbacteria bacterium]